MRVFACAVSCCLSLSLSACGKSEFAEARDKRLQEARREPPAPPNCPRFAELANLQLPDGSIADVRIFKFDQTKIYVPTSWLKLSDDVPDEDLGIYDPDVQRTECPGVVHQVTNGGILVGRYAGVYIDLGDRGKAPAGRRTGLYLQRIRTAPEHRHNDPRVTGFVAGMGTRENEDAYVRITHDVGVRLNWRPSGISRNEWQDRAARYQSGPEMGVNRLLKTGQYGPWGHLVGTEEWNRMERSVRIAMRWLTIPPAKRDNNQTFDLPSS